MFTTPAANPATSRDAPPGSFRRPEPPAPIELIHLGHPNLPAELEGLRILHVTDLHIRRGRPFPAVIRRLLEALRQTPADLLVLTGDWMTYPGDEAAALKALDAILQSSRPRLGAFGIFGNHDTTALINEALRLEAVRWLRNERALIEGLPLELVGAGYPEDMLGALLRPPAVSAPPFRIALAHYPTQVYPAAELDIPLLLAGHTHGGQVRLNARRLLHTSADLPCDLGCGLLRLRDTLCAVSRGIGNAILNFRINCPPQAPLYILHRADLPPSPDPRKLNRIRAW